MGEGLLLGAWCPRLQYFVMVAHGTPTGQRRRICGAAAVKEMWRQAKSRDDLTMAELTVFHAHVGCLDAAEKLQLEEKSKSICGSVALPKAVVHSKPAKAKKKAGSASSSSVSRPSVFS